MYERMSPEEAEYWHSEFPDAVLDLEADAGDFIFAADALVDWNKLSEFEDAR